MSALSREITALIAQKLAAENVAAWSPDTPYTSGQPLPPIFVKYFPANPPRAICLNLYRLEISPNPEQAGIITGFVQVRVRDQTNADTLADQVFTALEGHYWQGIQRCHRVSLVQMGLDSNGLDERADSYEVQLIRSNI